jgi:KUP system potassium uptake protein
MLADSSSTQKQSLLALSLGALGIVFGDIGTSPLYAIRECFAHAQLPMNTDNVYGLLSVIFWTIMMMISIKYIMVVLKADNRGEGGILSLMALSRRNEGPKPSGLSKSYLVIFGLFGAALMYGDGIITPAISVLSAVEGLKLVAPQSANWVIPITIFILNALFLVQKYGTARIGFVFGPVILVWFTVLGALGVGGIMTHPEILAAISPHYAFQFFRDNGQIAFFVLGSVVLVITGGEALYADMGHFGRKPIRMGWFFVAMPGLVLNYFGQGALLLDDPTAISNPFYLLAPKWFLWPLVILATLATIIASQALISGIFSITKQAIQMGFCPRLSIVHTSSKEIGQIYVPVVNWALFLGVIWLVLTFKSSSNLAAAYGIAVTGMMILTTLLAYKVARSKWKWSRSLAALVFGTFLVIDAAFFSANLLKIEHGGWFPLVVAAFIYLLMVTWQDGRKILYRRLKERSISVEEFCQKILREPPLRVSGTAIYMTGDPWGVPVPLLHNLKHNKVLHERVAILTIQTLEVPYVNANERVDIQEIIPNFYRIVAKYGFMEIPKMKHILEACREEDIHFQVQETTFVLGRETILPTKNTGTMATGPQMSQWRERIFAIMSRNAQRPTAFFKIPPNQVIEVGIQVEI